MDFERVVIYLLAFMDINPCSAKFETVDHYLIAFLEGFSLPPSFYNIKA